MSFVSSMQCIEVLRSRSVLMKDVVVDTQLVMLLMEPVGVLVISQPYRAAMLPEIMLQSVFSLTGGCLGCSPSITARLSPYS